MFELAATIATGNITEIIVVSLTAAVIAIHTLTVAHILTETLVAFIRYIVIDTMAIIAAIIKVDNCSY